jgi:radical SAM superfamily enzyme YgiQ (UPF0313 family)
MSDMTLLNLNMTYLRHFDTFEREIRLPLGPLYLTSALEAVDCSVDFRDYQLNRQKNAFDPKNISGFLKDPAEIVGVSCMANLLPFTILALKHFRERYPDRIIVLGGVGPSSVERRILEEFPWIDIIAKGEAERTLPQLVRALKGCTSLNAVRGIIYRDRGVIMETPPQERITDLDQIPLPAFNKVDLSVYEGYGMVTSRGCPYTCTLCSVAPIWGSDPRFRSNENIIEEMRCLNETAGVEQFLFQDEFFVSSKERVLAFCSALRDSGLDVSWKASGRVDLIDREMMGTMANSGCREMSFRVESGSDRILERTKKGFKSAQAIATITEAVDIFEKVNCNYIWGLPFEAMDDFYKSIFQMVSFRMMGTRILPSLFCLMPHTAVYREIMRENRLRFCPDLLPEYMLTGHEINHSVRISISREYRSIFDFISSYPAIFPGFFHVDPEENILPKMKILQEFGFYHKVKKRGNIKSPSEFVEKQTVREISSREPMVSPRITRTHLIRQ